MTTNPTPLTAEIILKQIALALGKDYLSGADEVLCEASIEAYAAQQNAELVAENERLKTSVQLFDEQGNRLLKALENKEAENERLKQQLAWQPIKTLPVHVPAEIYRTFKGGSHWFGVKTTLGSIGVHFGDDFIIVDDATHWRLPQPPKEAT